MHVAMSKGAGQLSANQILEKQTKAQVA